MTNPAAVQSFDEWYASLYKLYDEGKKEEALEIATREQHQFHEYPELVYHFRACLVALMHQDAAQVVAILTEGMGEQSWYPARFWDDGDLDTVRDAPEFIQLRKVSVARQAAAQEKVRPELLVVTPVGTGLHPLLLALHGNLSSIKEEGHHWRVAAQHGWLLGAAQANRIAQPERFEWNNTAQTDQELAAHYAMLGRAYALDPERVVLGGFSMGAETSIRCVLANKIPARGFIAVCPGGPLTHEEPERWADLLTQREDRAVRGVIVVGGEEPGRDNILALAERLKTSGITLKVVEYAGMGHDYPPDFPTRLLEWLEYICGMPSAE